MSMLGGTEVRELLERYGLSADRGLGQNFVTDPGVVRRMVALSGVGPGSKVLEIGPGLGSLTLALAGTGASVLAVEKDGGLLGALGEVLERLPAERRPRVVQADALRIDWPELLDGGQWEIVANLPYNVAVPIVITMLRCAPQVRRMLVMVQSEVADRLCAAPGGRTIGVPTIKVAWFATARRVMSVPPEVFTPRPRVSSAVVEIVRRPEPHGTAGPDVVFHLLETAYRQRRKMLRASLSGEVGAVAFERAGIDPQARPEQLSVHEWATLGAAVVRDART